jgi:hypothetical protein
MVGFYLAYTARRMEARPEDRPDADISEGSGEVGFFARTPGGRSPWPVPSPYADRTDHRSVPRADRDAVPRHRLMGLLFEYYVGINRSQGQTLGALQAQGERPTSVHKFLGD